ncbi:MAG: hypothetical protein NT157_00510 [Candidatus Micrarchaeota archaeon]|nr:hypothetical protein [Candidatus Micrarchaeota archaeon]
MRQISAVILLALACACFASFDYAGTLRGDEAYGWTVLSHPTGIYASGGAVYVADSYNDRVLMFENSTPFSSLGVTGSGSNALEFPNDVCAASSGRMLVADSGNDRIQIFRFGSRVDSIEARSASDVYALSFPYGVAASEDFIYVSDTNKNRVQAFFLSGYLFAFTIGGGSGFGDGQFILPKGIHYSKGRIYVADSGNDRIEVFLANGTFERSIRGRDDSALSRPADVCTDDEGRIFVADSGNSRVVVFSESGKTLETFGSKGAGISQFSEPGGIYADGNTVYVSDTGNSRVQVFKYSPPSDSPSSVYDAINFANNSARLADSARGAAMLLGADAPRENYSNSLEDAYMLYSLGRYPESLAKALESASSSRAAFEIFNSLSEARGRQILAETSTLLSTITDDAMAYSIPVDVAPYEEDMRAAKLLMDDRKYPEASAAITELKSSVLSLRSLVDGKKSATSSERDALLLAIADAKNSLARLSSLSSQYFVSVDLGDAEALLASAREQALNLSLSEARSSLSSAMEKISAANSSVSPAVSKVQTARESIDAARTAIERASGSSIFFPPDLSRAREALSQAEAALFTDPDSALSLSQRSLGMAGDAAGRSSALDWAVIIAIILLIALAAGVVYYAGRKRKKR